MPHFFHLAANLSQSIDVLLNGLDLLLRLHLAVLQAFFLRTSMGALSACLFFRVRSLFQLCSGALICMPVNATI
jgi:hypothetical protein